jgi:hypothetical protein
MYFINIRLKYVFRRRVKIYGSLALDKNMWFIGIELKYAVHWY